MPMQRRMRMIAGAATALCMLATNVEAATYYWVGVPSGSPNWEVADNWSTVSKGGAGGSHAVPTVLDNVVLSSSGTTVRLRSNAKVRSLVLTNTWTGSLIFGTGSLVVGSGSSVTGVQVRVGSGKILAGTSLFAVAGGYTQTGGLVNAQGVFSLSGSLSVTGTSSNFTSSGTIVLSGSGAQTLTLGTVRTLQMNSMTISNTGQATTNSVVVADNALNLSGALTVARGKLDLATNTKALKVLGDITVGSHANASLVTNTDVILAGSLLVRGGGGVGISGGTWTLTGQNQTLSGSVVFNNLAKTVTSADTLTFLAGGLQTVTGYITLQGASCDAKLSLRSSTSGTQWKLDPQGAQSLIYLDVKDMRNIDITTFVALKSIDSGNNINFAYSTCTSVATPAEVAAAASGGGGGGGGGVRRASVSSSKTVTTKVAVPAKPSAKVVAPTRASRVVVRKQATTLKKQSASVAARKEARMSKRK